MSPRYKPLVVAGIALAAAWLIAWAGFRIADHYRVTPGKVIAALRLTDLKSLEAAERAGRLRDLADRLARLTPEERRRARTDREWDRLWAQMTESEKGEFIERTMPSGVKQMLSAFEELPEDKRRRAITNAIARMHTQRERGEFPAAGERDREPLSEALQERIVTTGLKTFYAESSAQTKAEVAPLLEEMQQMMQNGRLFRR